MRKQLLNAALGTALGAALLAATPVLSAQVYVQVAPPTHAVEPPPPSPNPDWVWQAGYERWDGNAYVWVPGTWVAPPRPHATWVPGHWDHRHHGWFWVEGHWA
ncbi:MAG TPA: hypothetical protein VHY48_09990 [Acidobacteriaceae bacterium]|jgi:hypothetical protein|nr:hypothetical protein [Acidobacteriaceae bacterium]